MDKLQIINYILNNFHSQIAVDVIKMVMNTDTTLGMITEFELYFKNRTKDQFYGDTLNYFMGILVIYEEHYQKQESVIVGEHQANLTNTVCDVHNGTLQAMLSIVNSYDNSEEIIPLFRIKHTGVFIANRPEYELKVYRKL